MARLGAHTSRTEPSFLLAQQDREARTTKGECLASLARDSVFSSQHLLTEPILTARVCNTRPAIAANGRVPILPTVSRTQLAPLPFAFLWAHRDPGRDKDSSGELPTLSSESFRRPPLRPVLFHPL